MRSFSAVVLASLLAACGGGGDSSNPGASGVPQSASTSNAASRAPELPQRLWSDGEFVVTDPDDVPAQVYRLYSSAFDRESDSAGLGFHVGHVESLRHSLHQIAANFVVSPEFVQRYGSLSDEQYVVQLYRNVLGREPDSQGLTYHLGNLASGLESRGVVLVGFSESPENKQKTAAAIANGIRYTPWVPPASPGPGASGYISWNGSDNGMIILDGNNTRFRVRAGDRAIEDLNGSELTGAKVADGAVLIVNGTRWGVLTLRPSTHGGQVAVLRCDNDTPFYLTFSGSTYSYRCGTTVTPGGGGTAPIGGSPAPTTPGAPATTYVSWNGSINGDVVLDGSNARFRVRGSDGVIETADGISLNGSRVNGASVSFNGTAFGSVSGRDATSGGQVAVFTCTDGSLMTIQQQASSFSVGCQGSGGGTTVGSGGGAGSGTGDSTARWEYAGDGWQRSPSGQTQLYAVRVRNLSAFSIRCSTTFTYEYPDQDATFVRGFPVWANGSSNDSAIIATSTLGTLATPVVTTRIQGVGAVESQIRNAQAQTICTRS